MTSELPYIIREYVVTEREYNPAYGDDRVCVCGHQYYRHFDTYEEMEACGCKYCLCGEFKERTTLVRWVIEENVFSEKCFFEMVDHLNKHAIPYERIKIIPFIHEIDGRKPMTHEGPTVVYGSLGVQKVSKQQGWAPGVFGEPEAFQMDVYRDKLGDLFLNDDLEYMLMSDVEDYMYLKQMDRAFIKPRGDQKEFAGIVISRDLFREWYDNMISIGYLDNNDFEVVVSDVKELGCEWRLVVVGGVVVASSLYRQYQSVKPEEHWHQPVLDVAYDAIAKYQPAEVFILDIGQHGDEYKVIEYNNFNSAGFYDCNVPAIIDAVNTHVLRNYIMETTK